MPARWEKNRAIQLRGVAYAHLLRVLISLVLDPVALQLQAEELELRRQTLLPLRGLLLLLGVAIEGARCRVLLLVVRCLLRLGELESQRLGSRLIRSTFRIQAKCSHLILDLPQDLIGRGRSLRIGQVLHALELLGQVLLNGLDLVSNLSQGAGEGKGVVGRDFKEDQSPG